MSRRNEERLLATLGFLVVIAFIAAIFWLRAGGPCWIWTLSNTADVPARCIAEFTRGG